MPLTKYSNTLIKNGSNEFFSDYKGRKAKLSAFTP